VKELARFRRRARWKGRVFRHPFLERDVGGRAWPTTSRSSRAPAPSTPPPATARKTISPARAYGIPTFCPVDAGGRFYHAEGAPGRLPDAIIGKTVWEANPVVNAILREPARCWPKRSSSTAIPHCWRCHNPTIFRATEQWFIGMDRNGLRERPGSHPEVRWHPGLGPGAHLEHDRGPPRLVHLPAARLGRPHRRLLLRPVRRAPHRPQASGPRRRSVPPEDRRRLVRDAEAELLGPEARCAKCGSQSFRKGSDILDVWFDSGASHLAVLNETYGLPWPSDLYIEGGDQYRGWFHSSLLVGVGLRGGSPYRSCATHGWTLDGEGRAMSKSLGNIIEPQTIVKQYGAEVLRLWVASQEFTDDVRISETILARLSEAYRKLRNTFRYALGNLFDFDPEKDPLPAADLLEIDQWILFRAEKLVKQCRAWYDEMAFHKVYHAVYDFATTDLSAVYFDVLKDRLYTAAPAPGPAAAPRPRSTG
jgi:isoleucyl-tRNA synthetase